MMKPILAIETKTLTEILSMDRKETEYIRRRFNSLYRFNNDYILFRGIIAYDSILINQHYIDTLFTVIDYLYQYYEFSPRHFELLELAAGNLERLHQEHLATLHPQAEKAPKTILESWRGKLAVIFQKSSGKEGSEIRGEGEIQQASDERIKAETNKIEEDQIKTDLSDYLDKVALIFQTASDKAESEIDRENYGKKAKEYSAKADKVRGMTATKSHTEKILGLYEKATMEYAEGHFIRELFELRVAEYRARLQAARDIDIPTIVSRVSSSTHFFGSQKKKESPESTPLLSGELRHRKTTHSTNPDHSPTILKRSQE